MPPENQGIGLLVLTLLVFSAVCLSSVFLRTKLYLSMYSSRDIGLRLHFARSLVMSNVNSAVLMFLIFLQVTVLDIAMLLAVLMLKSTMKWSEKRHPCNISIMMLLNFCTTIRSMVSYKFLILLYHQVVCRFLGTENLLN